MILFSEKLVKTSVYRVITTFIPSKYQESRNFKECFLFNNEGKLVYHGAIDDNAGDAAAVSRKHLAQAMIELTESKEITVKQSRSVGGTIKRL